jgi:hypothetical protein
MTDHNSKRLGVQREDVLAVMQYGIWRTFTEIQVAVQLNFDRFHPEASISARLRDLRKERYGGYTVSRRSRRGNLFEYQVVKAERNEVQIGMFEEATV